MHGGLETGALDGRRMVMLIDVENVAGGPLRVGRARRLRSHLVDLAEQRCDTTMMIVGCCHLAAGRLTGFDGDRQLWCSGRDGAEDVLIEAFEREAMVERFDWLTVVSGDHAFVPTVEAARGSMPTTVVSWRHSLSARLRAAADEVVVLDDLLGTTAAGDADGSLVDLRNQVLCDQGLHAHGIADTASDEQRDAHVAELAA